jgi:hypothetical protein
MAFRATKQKVLNQGIPPDSFLNELQQFSVDLNQDGLPRLGEDLRH